jgi:hypothetical protein
MLQRGCRRADARYAAVRLCNPSPRSRQYKGLDRYQQLIVTLTLGKNVMRVYCELVPLDAPAGLDPAAGVAQQELTGDAV